MSILYVSGTPNLRFHVRTLSESLTLLEHALKTPIDVFLQTEAELALEDCRSSLCQIAAQLGIQDEGPDQPIP